MKLAIMGGTFNPIHIGHLVCAEEAASQFGFEQILFMPAGQPPHKHPPGGATAEHRFIMTEMATVDNQRFRVSRFEIDRPQPSYTVDTIRHFYQQLPDTEIFFITGADAVLEILEWKNPHELLKMSTLIAATRPGYPLDKLAGQNEFMNSSKVKVMNIPAIGVSSSDIRQRVSAGKPITYLVPKSVERFIEKEKLYLDR